MPLIKSKSKRAFSKNVETEMDAGKPQKQSLAIAYSVKRKAPKKKASGGTVESGSKDMNMAEGGMADLAAALKENTKAIHKSRNESGLKIHPLERDKKMAEGGEVSASDEKRPMPDMKYNDSKDVSQNSGKKPSVNDGWTDRPDIKQSTKGMKTTPIKHPKMVPQSTYTARLRSEEDDLQNSSSTNEGPQRQPPEHDNEEDADGSGVTPEKQTAISTGRQVMAEGGEIKPTFEDVSRSHNEKRKKLERAKINTKISPPKEFAEGGEINDFEPMSEAENDNQEDPAGLSSDDDQERPAKDEYMADHMQMLAEGGVASEEEIEHAASIAAAIMARRKMASGGSVESGSEDMNYADGGEVDLDLNSEEQPNAYYGLNEGEALDYNQDDEMDDQPVDSNEEGDDREDEESDPHGKSLASKIRAKTKASKKSPITR